MEWKKIGDLPIVISEMILRLDEKQAKVATSRPLPAIAVQKIKEALNFEWTYNSNSIEGNTLTLQETKLVLEEGLTVSGKSLKEHFEVVNHQEAIEYVYHLNKPNHIFCESDLLAVHSLVLNKIEKDYAGKFRDGAVRISGANFIPPNPLKIYEYIVDLINWVNDNKNTLHPLVVASIFHHRFVWIHPFFDGNGRTVRLISNLLLLKAGFPPGIILKADRKKYYKALSAADTGDYSKLFLLVGQSMERTLNIYMGVINPKEEYDSINNIVNEDSFPYGQAYVSLLARRGRIDAYKENGVWYTSKEAIAEYRTKRERQR